MSAAEETAQGREAKVAVLLAVGAERADRIIRFLRAEDYPPDQVTMIGLMVAALQLAQTSSMMAQPTHDDFVRLASTVFTTLSVEEDEESAPVQSEGNAGPPPVTFTASDFATLAGILRLYEKVAEVQPDDEEVIAKVQEASEFLNRQPAAPA